MSTENPLQKKVFEACDYLQQTGEEITRDKVREQTGGSDQGKRILSIRTPQSQ